LEGGKAMSMQQILDFAVVSKYKLVEITGGEPLLQDGVHSLIDNLIADNRTVLVETNGSLDISQINPLAVVIMDWKCPSSGAETSNLAENLEIIQDRPGIYSSSKNELKFVIKDAGDFEYAIEIIEKHKINNCTVLFSPCTPGMPIYQLAGMLLQRDLPENIRMQVRLHKCAVAEQSGIR
jgi:7-carboxy-7-deazaguanine synthase